MSGGHFDYVQHRIIQAADDVQEYINKCTGDEVDEYGYKPEFKDETIERFYQAEKALRQAAAMLQRVDWLICGDDGEDSFHERWDDECV